MATKTRPVMKEKYFNFDEWARRVDEAEQAQRAARKVEDIQATKEAIADVQYRTSRGEDTSDIQQAIKVDRAFAGDTSAKRTQDAIRMHQRELSLAEKMPELVNKWRQETPRFQTAEQFLDEYENQEAKKKQLEEENARLQRWQKLGKSQKQNVTNYFDNLSQSWEEVDYQKAING